MRHNMYREAARTFSSSSHYNHHGFTSFTLFTAISRETVVKPISFTFVQLSHQFQMVSPHFRRVSREIAWNWLKIYIAGFAVHIERIEKIIFSRFIFELNWTIPMLSSRLNEFGVFINLILGMNSNSLCIKITFCLTIRQIRARIISAMSSWNALLSQTLCME